MGIEQIAPDVYRIGMGYVSAYLIAQDDVAVIDTGLPKHRDIILRAASQAGRKPDDVKHIVLTHHHADHTGSLFELMAATSAKAYVHPLDAAIVRGESQPSGGCPWLPGSLVTHAAGDRPTRPGGPYPWPTCLPPARPVPGRLPTARVCSSSLAQQPGATACQTISSIYIRLCGPTPRCREVKPR